MKNYNLKGDKLLNLVLEELPHEEGKLLHMNCYSKDGSVLEVQDMKIMIAAQQ